MFDLPFDQSPETMARITALADEILTAADTDVGQALVDELWQAAQRAEPTVATMTLACACFIARTLRMIDGQGMPGVTLFRVMTKITTLIIAQQDALEAELSGRG